MDRYEIIKSVNDGDIVNVHTKSPLGIIIRCFEYIRYGKFSWSNHTAIITIEGGKVWVIEANPKMIRTEFELWINDAYINGKSYEIKRIPGSYWTEEMNPENIKADVDVLIGTKYAYADLIISMPIYMIFGKWINLNSNKRLFCSKAVAYILQKFTKGLFDDDNICPAKIKEICDNFYTVVTVRNN